MNESKKDNPSVSVIIPMYKCASFVSDMLDMVCGQTFKDIEIICVLDGPDDEIRAIVEKRIKEDKRITLIEQEHSGAGTARNTGMDIAQGDYLLFLDTDDLFEPKMIESLYEKAVSTDADVVMCTYTETNAWKKTTMKGVGFNLSCFSEDSVTDPQKVERLYRSFIGAPWNKLIRRSLPMKQNLRFSDTRIMNDEFFVVSVMTSAKGIAVIKEDLLTVRIYVNADSISTNRSKYTEDSVKVMKDLYVWLKEHGYWCTRREDYYDKFADALTYQSSYDYNEAFIDEVAHTLSLEQPWKRMSNVKLQQTLGLRVKDREKIRQNQADEIRVLNNMDNSRREMQLKMTENQINAICNIRSLMKDKYGRDLAKKDNPIARLKWSVSYRGWNGTLRKVREKLRGNIVIEPANVVCAGHISTAGHYLSFFLPAEIYHEEAYVEDMSMVVRCHGYYPMAVSGDSAATLTILGPGMTKLITNGLSTRKGEVIRVTADVSNGLGLLIQIRFAETLLKNKKGDAVDNNHPVSVQITGKIRLK